VKLNIRTLLCCIALLLAAAPPAPAQTLPANAKPAAPPAQTAQASAPPAPADARPARGDVDGPPLSGYVPVKVTSTENIVVKVGLAQHAPLLIGFPADDPLYSFHEGDENFAKVDQGDEQKGKGKPKPTDPLVVRAGPSFVVPPENSKEPPPFTMITVVRVSGVTATFVIVPVAKISQHAHHVELFYNTREVIAERAREGLRTNLVPQDQLAKAGVTPQGPASPATTAQAAPAAADAGGDAASVELKAGPEVEAERADAEIERRCVAELRRVGNANLPLRFSKPVHGLSLAVAPNPSPASDVTVEVIALRNTLSEPVRLVPDQPDLFIETHALKGGTSNLPVHITLLHVATNIGDDNVLQPGATYYVAFAYKAPSLGARQTIRASVAQMNANDEPATADLIAAGR
jgi:hypothetical protein